MPPTLSDTVRAIFRKYDSDQSGVIEKNEFVRLFTSCGLDEGHAHKMFEIVDIDFDGGVDYEEFLDWLLFPGKTGFVLDEEKRYTESEAAALLVRATGEEEAAKPQDGWPMCCEMDWRRAEVYCEQCDKYYSWDGFNMTHFAAGTPIEMRDHTTVRVWDKPATADDTSDPKYRRMAEAGVSKALDERLRKSLEAELRAQFAVYDIDGGGTISLEEMTKVAITMSKFVGENKTEDLIRAQVKKSFRNLDVDHNGSIELREFIKVIADEAMDASSGEYAPETITQRAKELTETLKFAMTQSGVKRKKKKGRRHGRK